MSIIKNISFIRIQNQELHSSIQEEETQQGIFFISWSGVCLVKQICKKKIWVGATTLLHKDDNYCENNITRWLLQWIMADLSNLFVLNTLATVSNIIGMWGKTWGTSYVFTIDPSGPIINLLLLHNQTF